MRRSVVDEGGAASTGEWSFEFALVGPGGEKVDLHRTFASHGGASLPPMRLDGLARSLDTTLPVAGGRPGSEPDHPATAS